MLASAPRSALRQWRSLRPRTRPAALASRTPLQRLLSTLALLEQRDGALLHSSLAAVTAAHKLGGPITALVAGGQAQKVAAEAAKVKELKDVLAVESAAYDRGLPEAYAELVAENVKQGGYTHVVAVHSAFGKNVLPRVAARLDAQQISDVMAVESEDTFVRPIYAGNAILTVQSSDPVKLFTVRSTAFPPAEPADGAAEIKTGADPQAAAPMEFVSEDLTQSDRPELATAGRVVAGGRGLKSKAQFDELLNPLAEALGAAIGASRAAVDSGFADNSLQVGQTGKNVAPGLYLCVGISGAIQHLAGMKDSKVIAAINKDPDSPIFGVADVGLVGDLFKLVPELTEKLKAAQ